MSNFFHKSAFNGNGFVSGFRDSGAHASTFGMNGQDHLTFHKPHQHDFSLETAVRLNDFNEMGGLEQRVTFLDAFHNSPLYR